MAAAPAPGDVTIDGKVEGRIEVRNHTVTIKDATRWVLFYVGLAVIGLVCFAPRAGFPLVTMSIGPSRCTTTSFTLATTV